MAEDNKPTHTRFLQIIGIALQITSFAVVIVALILSYNASTEALRVSTAALNHTMRPSFLIMELESGTSGSSFDEPTREYRVGELPGGAPHVDNGNVWNTGTTVAENVTVAIEFRPANSDIVAWDTWTIEKCRDIICITGTEGTNSSRVITMRAIEPGGFYTIRANYTMFLENFEKVGNPVTFSAEVKDGSTGQVIAERYTVYHPG